MQVDLMKLQTIVDNIDRVPRHLFVGHVLPLWNRVDDDYDWDSSFVGITDKGELVYIFESGCSCDEGPSWKPLYDCEGKRMTEEEEIPDLKDCKDRTVKGFEIEAKDIDYQSFAGIEESVDKIYNLLMTATIKAK